MQSEKNMNKPLKKSIPRYDYHECCNYLQDKYGYNERDYYGHFKDGKFNKDVEYCDFWHWFIAHSYVPTNGSVVIMYEEWGEGLSDDDWRKIIINHYLDEFGEGEFGNRSIEFWVEW